MRLITMSILLGAAFVLSGCQYLLGMGPLGPYPVDGSFDPGDFGSFDPDEPDFSMPPPDATYTTGSATLTIAGVESTLDRIAGKGTTYEEFGTDIAWTDGKGLYVRFYGVPGMPGDGVLTIDRIVDGTHWMTDDPTRCTVTITKSDATGLAGHATCPGEHWVDVMSVSNLLGPIPVAGEEAFDAEVEFSATP